MQCALARVCVCETKPRVRTEEQRDEAQGDREKNGWSRVRPPRVKDPPVRPASFPAPRGIMSASVK